jgi:hypothetical protein
MGDLVSVLALDMIVGDSLTQWVDREGTKGESMMSIRFENAFSVTHPFASDI